MNGFDTKLPESVTAAMKTLAEYLEVNAAPVSALDMQLQDLQLEDLRRIANGTYKVITTVPSLTDIVDTEEENYQTLKKAKRFYYEQRGEKNI